MSRKDIFIVFLIVGVLFLIVWNPGRNNLFRSFLFRLIFLGNLSPNEQLQMENIALRAKIESLKEIEKIFPFYTSEFIPAFIYAQYPFNFKNKFTINRGSKDGILKGKAVFFDQFLIGKVEEVYENQAVVITIFDTSWQSAVSIGERPVYGILVGGTTPTVTFIDKTAEINSGDLVINSSKEFPYGAPIGEILDWRLARDELTKEAQIFIPYDLSNLKLVLVQK